MSENNESLLSDQKFSNTGFAWHEIDLFKVNLSWQAGSTAWVSVKP